MFKRKENFVIALVALDCELLRISVGALARLGTKFTLIIYNGNPAITLERADVRKMGYRGRVHIINGATGPDMFGAIGAVVTATHTVARHARWIVFIRDCDLLLDMAVPNVSRDNFAVIQNMVTIRHRVSDMLRVMRCPTDYNIDDENVTLTRPHIGFFGSLVRIDTITGLCNVLGTISDKICALDQDLEYWPPYDAILWTLLNTFARAVNPDAVPIYMDRVGHISIMLDTANTKCGRSAVPARAQDEHYARATARFDAALRAALAAPTGQDI